MLETLDVQPQTANMWECCEECTAERKTNYTYSVLNRASAITALFRSAARQKRKKKGWLQLQWSVILLPLKPTRTTADRVVVFSFFFKCFFSPCDNSTPTMFQVTDLSACGWTLWQQNWGTIYIVCFIVYFFSYFLKEVYIIYFSMLSCCNATNVTDKHSFKGTPVKIFSKRPPGQLLLNNILTFSTCFSCLLVLLVYNVNALAFT